MNSRHHWFQAVAVYGQRRILAILFLGFSSGLPLALTGQTLSAWLKEDGVSLTAIGLFAAIGTPYALKFLWAPAMDRLPIGWLTRRFGRRRGWLLLTQAVLILATLALAQTDPVQALGTTAVIALIVAFASASQDIVIDAYRVEILDDDQLAAGAAVYVYGYRIAMLVSSAGALALAEFVGWSMTYTIMAGFLVVGVVTVLLNPEPKAVITADFKDRLARATAWAEARPNLPKSLSTAASFFQTGVAGPFAEFMKRPGWVPILLFVMFYKLGDSLAGVMTIPFLLDIGFNKLEIAAAAKLVGFWTGLIGLGVGGWLMMATGLVRSLWICGILQLVSNFMFAVQAMVGTDIALLAVTIGLENLASGMGTAVFVAYLSSLCNLSYTATQYALVSSFMAVARTWFSASSGYFAVQFGWFDFFVFTAVAALPGLALLWWLTRSGSVTRPDIRRDAIGQAND
jgi:PAT family beta-lactamase induction signal transducer AmpG